uniref:glutathione transferase n=2 Tax=Caenorhabditis japonica TaxID=281687 RepID=A0A8R1HW89_CAEJA
MTEYKLQYFNMMGHAEPARLIFAYAGVQYEDERVEKSAWPKTKPTTPHGQLPVLYVDGKPLSQSRVIERYLAKAFGLAGENDWEMAKMDELVACVEDFLIEIHPWFKEQDNAKKVEIFKKLIDSTIIPFITAFETILVTNGTGYFVGDKISFADLAIFHIFWFMNSKILPGALRKYPKLLEFVDKIAAIDTIKSWINSRPKTEA